MVIYLDLLLIENYIVNKFLLYLTAQTLRVKTKYINITLSAFIGGMYTIVVVITKYMLFTSIIFKFIVAIAMILITFKNKNLIFNFKAVIIFILYSMMLAGLCVFIQFSENGVLQSNVVIYNFSYKKLILSVMIIYMVSNRIVYFIKDRKELSNYIYTVDIVLNSAEKTVNAFLDTGNELVEPATNLPVMIVEKNVLDDVDINDYDIFYIPYKVVNGYRDKLKAIKPKYIKVHSNDEVKNREVIIAFCNNSLSNYGDYNALLSRGIL